MTDRLDSDRQRSRRRSKGRVVVALGGVAAAAGMALFGVSQANATVVEKQIKVLANEEHKSFDVIVANRISQCVDNPDPGAPSPVSVGMTVRVGETVTVKANLLDCSFNAASHDTEDIVTVPDDDSTEVVLGVT